MDRATLRNFGLLFRSALADEVLRQHSELQFLLFAGTGEVLLSQCQGDRAELKPGLKLSVDSFVWLWQLGLLHQGPLQFEQMAYSSQEISAWVVSWTAILIFHLSLWHRDDYKTWWEPASCRNSDTQHWAQSFKKPSVRGWTGWDIWLKLIKFNPPHHRPGLNSEPFSFRLLLTALPRCAWLPRQFFSLFCLGSVINKMLVWGWDQNLFYAFTLYKNQDLRWYLNSLTNSLSMTTEEK